MKVHYDPETDTLMIQLREEPIVLSELLRPGLIADIGKDGRPVRLELLRASSYVNQPTKVKVSAGY